MKSLHLCNLANVAYGYAKILRAGGHEADVRCHDIRHLMSQPEWDDLLLDSADFPDEDDFFTNTAALGDYTRPEWFRAERLVAMHPWLLRLLRRTLPRIVRARLAPWYHTFQQWKARARRGMRRDDGDRPSQSADAHDRCRRLADRSRRDGPEWALRDGAVSAFLTHADWVARHAEGCHVIFAYVLAPIYAMIYHRLPYVSVEIGTMRDLPFDGTEVGRLLALAYRQSDHVLITNPDVRSAAERLGLERYSFCPHPLDEDVYRPAEGETDLRRDLLRHYGAETILFAPARQNWAIKGNDKVFRAFAQLLASRPKTVLIVPGWGQEIERSRRLCRTLGIDDRVDWIRPMSEPWLVRYYQASDLVLDQFQLGVFGLTTPKAMACGKPVLTSYDHAVNAWAFPEPPPVLACGTEKEIYEAMDAALASPQRRAELADASRRWVVQYHAKDRIRRVLLGLAEQAIRRRKDAPE